MPDELSGSEPGELLRAALRAERGAGGDAATPGEAAALAAFRAARDEGLHTSLPTRDVDDWTPAPAPRRPRRSLKAGLAVLVASLTLGGVAVATGDLPDPFLGTPVPPPGPSPTRTAPAPAPTPPYETGATAGAGVGASASRSAAPGTTAPLRPEKDPVDLPGRSREALCRAFEEKKGGQASKSAARQRLVAAAGGEELVPRYCRTDPVPDPSAQPRTDRDGGYGDPSARPGRGPERSRGGRP
ncbi:hypothetical protein ACFV2S_07565 [Streptomyces sp. NPDC059695]|uniref:hypothetical protein n=1 Tax=Streptomyces sp. NPDC059695 TaxID=3346910 RepID=UPI00368361C9